MQKPTFFAILCVSLTITAVSLGFAASRYLSIRYYAPPPPAAAADPRSAGETRSTIPPEQWTNVFAPSAGMGVPSRYDKTATGSQVLSLPYDLAFIHTPGSGGKANAPLAVRATREAVLRGAQVDDLEGIRIAVDLFRPVARSEDAKEGPLAFVEKRDPEWKAR